VRHIGEMPDENALLRLLQCPADRRLVCRQITYDVIFLSY
jgi:hypothetical protein